jgi:ATP-dependent Clp protease protease subunit
MKENKKFWNWLPSVKDETEPDAKPERVLELYGTIATDSWYDDEVTPKMFHDELFSGSGPVTIWLCSPGGDCIAASQIYSMLVDYPYNVTVKIDGIAASAASVVAMAGTKVLMAPTALLMLHNPMSIAIGDSEEMQKAIEMLSEVKESILNAYEIKTNLSRTKLSNMMDGETWLNAKKAIELGFADGILEDEKKRVHKDDVTYAFSRRAVTNSLLDKLKIVRQPQTEKAANTGVRADDLYKRLSLIQH